MSVLQGSSKAIVREQKITNARIPTTLVTSRNCQPGADAREIYRFENGCRRAVTVFTAAWIVFRARASIRNCTPLVPAAFVVIPCALFLSCPVCGSVSHRKFKVFKAAFFF